MMVKFWIIAKQMINRVVASIIVFLDMTGAVKILFKNPNSLSKTRGNPAFNELVKEVKIMMPQLRKGPYLWSVLNRFRGAFWNRPPNRMSHSNGWMIPDIMLDGLLSVCINSLCAKCLTSCIKFFAKKL